LIQFAEKTSPTAFESDSVMCGCRNAAADQPERRPWPPRKSMRCRNAALQHKPGPFHASAEVTLKSSGGARSPATSRIPTARTNKARRRRLERQAMNPVVVSGPARGDWVAAPQITQSAQALDKHHAANNWQINQHRRCRPSMTLFVAGSVSFALFAESEKAIT